MKRALITGVAGQDGGFLAELLLEQHYEVHGAVRRLPVGVDASQQGRGTLGSLRGRIKLWEMDLLDQRQIDRVVAEVEPHEIYNLAAQSSVAASWHEPVATADATALGAARLLQAIVAHAPGARFFQAGSSEIFGRSAPPPQNEKTPFAPSNPYGVAKHYAHSMTLSFRQHYGLFACNGILFNHESPRRGPSFVTRKITSGVARIHHGLATELRLGSLDAERDWGSACDFVRAMWLMLQADEPDDYVIGVGQTHSVREFVELAFSHVGLDWRRHVVVDPRFVRPAEPTVLRADATKARSKLGWKPEVNFKDLVRSMVESDLAQVAAELNAPPLRKAA